MAKMKNKKEMLDKLEMPKKAAKDEMLMMDEEFAPESEESPLPSADMEEGADDMEAAAADLEAVDDEELIAEMKRRGLSLPEEEAMEGEEAPAEEEMA